MIHECCSMASTELPPLITSAKPIEVIRTVIDALDAIEVLPSSQRVACHVGHSALEAGNWRAMHNWCFAHVKWRGVGDFAYWRASEFLSKAEADSYIGQPGFIGVLGHSADGSVHCLFDRPHKQARFRAYASMREAVDDYMRKMRTEPRYSASWLLADHIDYGKAWFDAIGKAGFHTTKPLSSYTAQCVERTKHYMPLVQSELERHESPWWGAVKRLWAK